MISICKKALTIVQKQQHVRIFATGLVANIITKVPQLYTHVYREFHPKLSNKQPSMKGGSGKMLHLHMPRNEEALEDDLQHASNH